jgi:hypothetical protein
MFISAFPRWAVPQTAQKSARLRFPRRERHGPKITAAEEVHVPTLQEAKELVSPLEELVRELKSELNDSKGDFDRLVQLADELGELADELAETFGSINETLMDRIKEFRGNGAKSTSRRKTAVAS